jgi:hypothetical protein
LLERRIVIRELLLAQPLLKLPAEAKKRETLAQSLVDLIYLKGGDAAVAVDLREFEVKKGELIVPRHRAEGREVGWHFQGLDLRLRPVNAGTGGLLSSETQTESGPPQGLQTLEFQVRTTIERQKKRGGLSAKGSLSIPAGALQFEDVFIAADVRGQALPVEFLTQVSGPLPVRLAAGSFDPALRLRGRLGALAAVQGAVDFQRLEVDAGEVPPAPFHVADGRLEMDLEWGVQEVRIARFSVRSGDLSVSGRGLVRSPDSADPYWELGVETPFVPAAEIARYLPAKAFGPALEPYVTKGIKAGQVKVVGASFAGHLSEARRSFGERLSFEIELRGMAVDLPGDRYLPLQGVSGTLASEKGVLRYKGLGATYGSSKLSDVEITLRNVFPQRRVLELSIRGESDLADLPSLMESVTSEANSKVASRLQGLSGAAAFTLSARTDFNSVRDYRGRLSITKGQWRGRDAVLSEIQGEISISPKEIRAINMTAVAAGSPIQFQATVSDYLTDSAVIDVTVRSAGVSAGEVNRIFFGTPASDARGTVRGSLSYRAWLARPEQGKLSGSLELVGAELPWKLLGAPVRETYGTLRIEGNDLDLQGLRGRWGGSAVRFSGQWRPTRKPQLTFVFDSPRLDLNQILQGEAEPAKWQEHLEAKGKLTIGRAMVEDFDFAGVRSDVTVSGGEWRLQSFAARWLGGSMEGEGSFGERTEGFHFAVEPKVSAVPAQAFFNWLGSTAEVSGVVLLHGRFESQGVGRAERKKNLGGAFHFRVENGTLKRFQLLVRLLSIVDLSRWFTLSVPDLNQQGIRFRSITADFKIQQGIYSTQNLFVDSDDLRITGAGEVDGTKGEVDLVIALRPFPRLDTAASYIPLIGPGLAAIKNTLLVASFRLRGPMDNPTITPAPLHTLSEFLLSALAIPRSLIPIPGQSP